MQNGDFQFLCGRIGFVLDVLFNPVTVPREMLVWDKSSHQVGGSNKNAYSQITAKHRVPSKAQVDLMNSEAWLENFMRGQKKPNYLEKK